MPSKGAKFLEEVFVRRERFEARSNRAAVNFQRELRKARAEIQERLRSLSGLRDPRTGLFVDTQAARAAAQGIADDIDRVLARSQASMVDDLISARESAMVQQISDMRFAVEEIAGKELSVSFSQMFEEAALISANAPVLGVKPNAAFNGIRGHAQREVRSAITQGIIQGQSIPKIAARINEVMGQGMRAATRIARTNMTASAAEANRMIFDSDPEIFAGYRWDATFDSRTSEICASLHGTFYPLGVRPPGPPAHWNCRSDLFPVFKDKKLQREIDNAPRRVARFNKGGEQVGRRVLKTDERFDAWMKKQPEAVTAKLTGSSLKNELFRSGRIRMTDIVADDLSIRSDREVLQGALARRPKDKGLQKIAKRERVRRASVNTVEQRAASAAARANRARFAIGQKPGHGTIDRARAKRLDEALQDKRADSVGAAAKRAKR